MNALNGLASDFSNVSGTISSLRAQIDQQVVNSISSTNTLIKQIYDLNTQIRNASSGGDSNSGLLDQRDTVLNNLAQIMDIKTTPNARRQRQRLHRRRRQSGVQHLCPACPIRAAPRTALYGNITSQDINPNNGNLIGTPQPLDPHLSGGSLKGLIDMRDQTLGGLPQTLGNLAQQTATAFNAQANANAAYPPPTSLTGRDTGLLVHRQSRFHRQDHHRGDQRQRQSGQPRVDVDFDAGTLSVDGGASTAIGTDVGSFTDRAEHGAGRERRGILRQRPAFHLRHRRQRHPGAG